MKRHDMYKKIYSVSHQENIILDYEGERES